jgi:hypothetical protein
VSEVSVILKNILITQDEFRVLDRCSSSGRIWTLTQRPTNENPYIVKRKTVEYIFDTEALTMFMIISNNVLVTWDTELTRHLVSDDEIRIRDSMYIRLYISQFA